MAKEKKKLEVVVLSDIHLGTYGSRAGELLRYLKSIDPQTLILNGDTIDIWQFKKKYWPASHTAVIKYIMGMMAKGTKVEYICGNHDDLLRRYLGFETGNFRILNHMDLQLGSKTAWVFHGDVFDRSMKAKWLAKWGGRWYDRTIRFNGVINWFLTKFGKKPIRLSKIIKDKVKGFVKKKHDWEDAAAAEGIERGYDFVITGHIHKPDIRTVVTEKGSVRYLNSGDWMENMTSLEYAEGQWSLYRHDPESIEQPLETVQPAEEEIHPSDEKAFAQLILEFGMMGSKPA